MFRRLSLAAALACAVALMACVPAGLQLAAAAESPSEPIAIAAAAVKRDAARAPAPGVSFSIPLPVMGAPSPAPAPAPIHVDPTPVQVNVAPSEAAPVHVTVAAPATAVTFSWGDWLLELVQIAAGVAGPIGVFLLGLVKGPVGVALRLYFTEKKIAELAGYAVNAVAGAAKDKVLTVDVGNQVIAAGLQYAADNFPAAAIKALGGEKGIRDKLLSVLNLEESASVQVLQDPPAA